MKIHKILDHIAQFLIHPNDAKFSPSTRKLAWITTIFTGILTLAIPQMLSALWLKLRPKPSDPHMQDLFNENHPNSKKNSSQHKVPDPSISEDPLDTPFKVETVNGFPIDEMNSLNEYIRNYHSGSDNKFSIRALGKDWCVWFDGNANRVLVQEQERFDANQGEKIELLINHINVSIYAPSMDYKYLIRRIIEEVASMRLIREEPSTEQRQSPIRVNVNQTPHQEPISRVRETPVVYTYPETSHLRKNPTPMVNNGPKDLKLQLTHSEMHETRAQLFPDAKSADQPGKLSCAQDWNLFRNTLRDFIGAIKHSSFISKFAVCDLGELGIFNVYSEGDSKNQFICITKQGEESPYIRVKIDEFGFIETLFVNGEEHIAFESKSKSKKESSENDLPADEADTSSSRRTMPGEIYSILNGCFLKTIEKACSTYLNGNQINVAVPFRCLAKIPEFCLIKIYEFLKSSSSWSFPCFKVSFLNDNLQRERGTDAGGLSRHFMDDLFQYLTQSQKISFFTSQLSKAIPSSLIARDITKILSAITLSKKEFWLKDKNAFLTPQEGDLFLHGGVFDGVLLLDWRPQNGIVFFTSLFAAVLAFNEEEFSQSFDSLEEETLFRVAAALFESRLTLRQSATMYNLLKAITAFRDLVNDDTWGKKIEDLTEEEKLKQTEKDQQIIKLLIDAGVPNLPDCTGLDAQFVDEDECTVNLDTIKEKKEEFFKELKRSFLTYPDAQFGILFHQIEAIHHVGKGLYSFLKLRDKRWSTIKEQGAESLSNQIQGAFDRQKIANSLQKSPSNFTEKKLIKKFDWLKNWLSDEDTPEEKIQLFLKFVTGTSSLANHGIISVGAYNLCETPTALMKSHTCSSAVDIWNETFTTMVEEDGIEKEYSDDNEEGFIKILSRGIANKENMKYFGQT